MKIKTTLISLVFFAILLFTANVSSAQTLVAHYKFDNNYDDATPLTDDLPLQKQNWPGVGFTSSGNTDPNSGNGYYFDSSSVSEPDSGAKLVSHDGTSFLKIPSTLSGNNPKSITAWVKTGLTTSAAGIVGLGFNATNEKFTFLMAKGGALRLERNGGGFQTTETINNNQWYHVACTYIDGAAKLYIDGELKATSAWTGIATRANTSLVVGAGKQSGRPWIGGLDDVRIYSGELSQTDIAAIAMASKPTLGIEDNRITNTFRAYPNPVNDILTIASKTVSSPLNVAVYNMLGAKVKTNVSQVNGEVRVDMSRLASGFYSVIVTADGKQSSLKILKD